MDNANKLDDSILASVMVFKNPDESDAVFDDHVALALVDWSDEEVELAYSIGKQRTFLRLRRDDLARLVAPPKEPQA